MLASGKPFAPIRALLLYGITLALIPPTVEHG
jgi:hypothetical protein